jgi:hypothetical protein
LGFTVVEGEDGGLTATVIGFTDDRILTDLTIPDTIEFRGKTCRVTAIGDGAFDGCSGLKGKLTLPAGLTEIGGEAFKGCSGLSVVICALGELIISEGYSGYIGIRAFYGCSGLTSLTIPGVTKIDNQAFDGCSGLTSVVLLSIKPPVLRENVFHDVPLDCNFTCPDGALALYQRKDAWIPRFGYNSEPVVKGLKFQIVGGRGDGYTATLVGFAFARGEMPVLTIPDTVEANGFSYPVTKIGNEAFAGCSRLTSVTLPKSLTEIGDRAFSDCDGLTSVTLPKGLTEIGNEAFFGCSGLTGELILPAGLTAIGDFAFSGCSGLSGELTLPAGLAAIGEGVFSDCSGLSGELILPSDLTVIGGGAFSGCSGLTGELILPSDLTTIGGGAFSGCSGLTSLMLPSGLTAIGERAFDGCSGLTSLTLPSGLTAIGERAFNGCSGLTSVVLLSVTPPALGGHVFHDIFPSCNFICPDGALALYQGKDTWEPYFGHEGTLVVKGLKFQIVEGQGKKSTATLIGFASGRMPDLTIPDTIKIDRQSYPVAMIDNKAFNGYRNLTSVTFPTKLASIGSEAFSGCSGLTSVTFPTKLASIGSYAFNGCSGLTSLTFPASLTEIGKGAFSDCSGLKGELKLPANIPAIDESVFNGCSGLTSVTFPKGLTKIGNEAFNGCSGLTSVTFLSEEPPVSYPRYNREAFSNMGYGYSGCEIICPEKSFEAYRAALRNMGLHARRYTPLTTPEGTQKVDV